MCRRREEKRPRVDQPAALPGGPDARGGAPGRKGLENLWVEGRRQWHPGRALASHRRLGLEPRIPVSTDLRRWSKAGPRAEHHPVDGEAELAGGKPAAAKDAAKGGGVGFSTRW